jgi:hypothetical protein
MLSRSPVPGVAAPALAVAALLACAAVTPPTPPLRAEVLVPAIASVLAGLRGGQVGAGTKETWRLLLRGAWGGALVGALRLWLGPVFLLPGDAESLGSWYPVLLAAMTSRAVLTGALAGAALAVWSLPVLRVPVEDAPGLLSIDARERALFRASLWLGVTAGAASLLWPTPLLAGVITAALALVAAASLAVGARDARRAMWLSRVGAGRIPGWSVVADGGPAPSSPVPMFARYPEGELDAYLVRDGARRVAELPHNLGRARTPLVRRAALAAALAIAAIAGAVTCLPRVAHAHARVTPSGPGQAR